MESAHRSTSAESTGRRRRQPSPLRALLLLNFSLLLVLGVVTFGASSEAQPRARGEYTMVAGEVRGTNAGAVYVVDVRNEEMMVIAYNNSENRLEGIAYRNLRRDFENLRGDQAPGR